MARLSSAIIAVILLTCFEVAIGFPSLLAAELNGSNTPRNKAVRPSSDNISMNKSQSDSIRQSLMPVQTRTETVERNITAMKESIADTRTLVHILLGIQFAIILAFLGLAWWLEQKTRRLIETLNNKVENAKLEIDKHSRAVLSGFQSRISQAFESLSRTRTSQDLLLSGKVLFWTGKPERALEVLNTALSFDNQDPEVRKFRGLCLIQLGTENLREAVADLEVAISNEVFHNDAHIHFDLARAYFGLRYWTRAIDAARVAEIKGYPSKEQTQLLVADSLKYLRRFDEALALYDKMIADNPRSTIAINHKAELLFNKGDFDQVIALYQVAISNRTHVSKYHIFLANAYVKRDLPGDWEKALEQFDEAERVSPVDWDLWYYKGRAHLHKYLEQNKLGLVSSTDFEAAEQCFRHGETISKKSVAPRFINQISRLYLFSKQTSKAVDEARRSVTLNHTHIQNYLTLCTALLASKQWPEALSSAQESLRLFAGQPGSVWSLYFIVLIKSLQRHDIKSLKSDLSQLILALQTVPYFDYTGWDWSTAQQVVEDEVARLSEDVKNMLQDLWKAMLDPTQISTLVAD